MNTGKRALWLFIMILSLAGFAWYFASNPAYTFKLDKATLSTTIDTTIAELTVQQFDDKGQLTHLLKTPLLQHIPKHNQHLLNTPYIVINQPQQQSPWEIQAKKAISINGGEKITFINNVIIQQKSHPPTTVESTITTEKMTYFPKKQLATTTYKVVFDQPGSQVEAIGLNAFLNEKRVQLLSHARGSYVPKHG